MTPREIEDRVAAALAANFEDVLNQPITDDDVVVERDPADPTRLIFTAPIRSRRPLWVGEFVEYAPPVGCRR